MENAAIEEMFASLGPVTIRKMFGGKGVYFEGRIIALELDGQIRLKADKVSEGRFAAAGSEQWTYDGKKAPVRMPYWSIPDHALDDFDELAQWVKLAFEAALRAKR